MVNLFQDNLTFIQSEFLFLYWRTKLKFDAKALLDTLMWANSM